MTSRCRRRLPAVLQRMTSGCERNASSSGSARGSASLMQMPRGVGAAAVDALEDVRLRLLAKPFQPGDLAVLAGLFELLDRFDPQLVVQRLDLLGAQAGDVEHRHQARRGSTP